MSFLLLTVFSLNNFQILVMYYISDHVKIYNQLYFFIKEIDIKIMFIGTINSSFRSKIYRNWGNKYYIK